MSLVLDCAGCVKEEVGKILCSAFTLLCTVIFSFYVFDQFLTDGMLVREMMWDPLLKKYRLVVVSV